MISNSTKQYIVITSERVKAFGQLFFFIYKKSKEDQNKVTLIQKGNKIKR